MYYQILEKLKISTFEDCLKEQKIPFVAVLKPEEWINVQDQVHMGIDMDFNIHSANSTKAEVNLDSLTGTFKIPKRDNLLGQAHDFSFVLDERAIIFIDEHDYVQDQIKKIQKTKKWKYPSLERFIYDFLENIIKEDLVLLEKIDRDINLIEENIISASNQNHNYDLILFRRKLTKLNVHYSQLIDLSQEFYENENDFFAEEQLRFFHLFASRVSRLQSMVLTLRETIVQIRDLSNAQLEMKQNKIMAVLTVITASCMPLTILVGWYGMNFKYMPELSSPWGYPLIIIVAILLFTSSILYFKSKKWL
ncbi:magnesium transporter CorA family protein [Streptococcus catagoni]|uniref:magnesium transporter CorA family protein n=1 Tax=Streptococcus catagoni TaxID=2654874 RepID=UPI00140BAAFB|nr:CorA family divalent cation transporter [Streptococcus catagoni]